MIKLITCDVDGTLVKGYTESLDEELFVLIEKFYKKGVLFFATSGRQLYNLRKIFAPVDDKIGYIAQNGSIVMHNNEVLYKSIIDRELANSLAQKILNKDGAELFVSGQDYLYIIKKSNDVDQFIESELNNTKVINSVEEITEDIVKVTFFCNNGLNEEIIDHFVTSFGDKFQHAISGDNWYDFMNIGTHKGNAIRLLQKQINVTSDETVAFGDNFNDIEMLADAKYSYAMEDAHQDVKNVAKYTCENVVKTLKTLYSEFFGEE